jgi:hypothetical protein
VDRAYHVWLPLRGVFIVGVPVVLLVRVHRRVTVDVKVWRLKEGNTMASLRKFQMTAGRVSG